MAPQAGPYQALLRFHDGEEQSIAVNHGESLLAAALRNGIRLVHQCESGSCGTCVARVVNGQTENMSHRSLALLPGEIELGYRLTCSLLLNSDATVEFNYPAKLLEQAGPKRFLARVSQHRWLSATVIQLELELNTDPGLRFTSGQYIRIKVPGTDSWRSYSIASLPSDLPSLTLLIRYLESGEMSEYLKQHCQIGDELEIEGPMGSFCIDGAPGPIIMIAGGTGLAPLISMLGAIKDAPGPTPPILLCFGCTEEDDLFYDEELELQAFWMPTLSVRTAAEKTSAQRNDVAAGTAVSLLTDADLSPDDLAAYLCGPPAMVTAARERLVAAGVAPARIYAEQFRPSEN